MIYQLAVDYLDKEEEGFSYCLYKYGEAIHYGRSGDIDSIKELLQLFIYKVHDVPREKVRKWFNTGHQDFPMNIKDFDAKE